MSSKQDYKTKVLEKVNRLFKLGEPEPGLPHCKEGFPYGRNVWNEDTGLSNNWDWSDIIDMVEATGDGQDRDGFLEDFRSEVVRVAQEQLYEKIEYAVETVAKIGDRQEVWQD